MAGENSTILQQEVYVSGEEGYHTYRVPALVVTARGTLLAFCEGRKTGAGDAGNIDLLVKRSLDNGKTWSRQQVIWDDGGNTCGNPCPIVDHRAGTVLLLVTWNHGDDHERQIVTRASRDTRRVFVASSRDDGQTWTRPCEVTAQAKKPQWTWYATGPGAGIQVERGPHAGRLVVPCDHIEAETEHYYSHVIFSDDHGETWQRGGRTPWPGVNECQVIELSRQRLMLNMRSYDRSAHCRQICFSEDGGATWRDQDLDLALIEPRCQASLRADAWNGDGTRQLVLFSNPASEQARVNLTVRASLDEGRSWPGRLTLHAGPCAYSDLAVLPDGWLGCLFEAGQQHPYERIVFASFSRESMQGEPCEGS